MRGKYFQTAGSLPKKKVGEIFFSFRMILIILCAPPERAFWSCTKPFIRNWIKRPTDGCLAHGSFPTINPSRTFSKGMRRRLFIAIAIAAGPKYLLLDEAFDGLDPLARLTVKSELNRLADENGTGVLISSHSLRELEDFCDSYALIDRKTVTHSGDLSQDLGQYCKFQLAYTLPVEKSWFEGLPTAYVELNGKFVKVILKGKSVAMEEALRRTQPAVLEEMPMDFEEMFIHQVEDRGYLNK